jgi:hypothetical protein
MKNDDNQDNESMSHDQEWTDRMEGNIKGKNKPSIFKVGKNENDFPNPQID